MQQYFSNIGNHANNMQDVDNFKDNVRKKVAKLDENLVPTTDMFSLRFSRTSIETSLKNLDNGKAVGDDGIPNEFLKNGGEAMLNSLVDLFTVVSDLEIIPSEWKNGIIKPLHKSGSAMDLDNYRGITLTSNVYKVFSKILEECIMSHLEEKNILGEAQGAFRRDRRLEDHLFTLHGLCSLQKYAKKKTYIAFLDLSKAFDRVWRDGLFYLLWENGIQGKCWRLLRSIYDGVSNKVVFGDFSTEWFGQENGLKQGCVLSPTLFSVLMNDLVNMLDGVGIGIDVGKQLINCLLFADDIALIAETEEELKRLLDVASAFVIKWNLSFNFNKSKVLVVGKRVNRSKQWKLGSDLIEEVNEYKYVGVYFSRSLKFNYHINSYVKENADQKLNLYYIRILGEHRHFNRLSFGDAL